MKNIKPFTKLLTVPVFVAAMGVSPTVFAQYGDSPAQREQTGTNSYFDDAKITKEVKVDILKDPTLKEPQISVETMQGVVQLNGSVASELSDAKAVEIAKNVEGVTSVKDDLVIR